MTLGNITPLSVKPSSRAGLVLAVRRVGTEGHFTAGVLTNLCSAGFNLVRYAVWHLCRAQNLGLSVQIQPGYACKVITRYTTAREVFLTRDAVLSARMSNPHRSDWKLVDSTGQKCRWRHGLCWKTVLAQGKEFRMCACRGDDYIAQLLFPTQQTRSRIRIPAPPARDFPASTRSVRYAGWGESHLDGVCQAMRSGAGGRSVGRRKHQVSPHCAFADATTPRQWFNATDGALVWRNAQPAAVCESGTAPRNHLSLHARVH